jgi:hypothetical protein
VKLGAISLSFKADVKLEEADELMGRAKLSTKAREARGRGNASATIESRGVHKLSRPSSAARTRSAARPSERLLRPEGGREVEAIEHAFIRRSRAA